jgi:hypothetical protein
VIVLDATMLLLFLQPDAGSPRDIKGQPVTRAHERINFLVTQLEQTRTTIIVPTPALSEALIRVDAADAARIVDEIARHSVFSIRPFDTRASIEVAAMLRSELRGGKKKMKAGGTWAKVKYDRQIVAIAIVAKAVRIYSDDSDIKAVAKRAGIQVIGVQDLPLPPEDPNLNLFEPPEPLPHLLQPPIGDT